MRSHRHDEDDDTPHSLLIDYKSCQRACIRRDRMRVISISIEMEIDTAINVCAVLKLKVCFNAEKRKFTKVCKSFIHILTF